MQATLLEIAPRLDASFMPPYPRTAQAPRERRPAAHEELVATLLDELDYGVMLLREGGQVAYINHAARAELRLAQCVVVEGGVLQACCPADAPRLAGALAAAQRGLRRLLTLGQLGEGTRRTVALVPVGASAPDAPGLVAAVFGRRQLCEPISVQCFAQAHALTPAETRVLQLLCEGLEPREIAKANGVGMATVRTQVHCIRDKTGAASIRALIHCVAMLPPMVSSLRA